MNVTKYLTTAIFSIASLGAISFPALAQYSNNSYSCPYTYYLDDAVVCTESADAYSSLSSYGGGSSSSNPSPDSSHSSCFQQYDQCTTDNTNGNIWRDLDCAVDAVQCVKREVWD